MKKIVEKIESFEFSTREYLLVGLIIFFAGLLVGMIVSPKGDRTIGSNNGNNSGNNNGNNSSASMADKTINN